MPIYGLRSPIVAGTLALAATMAVAQARPDRPGDRHHIRPSDLPRPFHTRSVDNGPTVVPQPSGTRPQVPAGFRVDLFYEGTLGGENSPRSMALAPNGDVFTTDSGGHKVYVLRDRDRDSKAESLFTFATREHGLELPFGIAFRRGHLYVASTNHLSRFPYAAGQTQAKQRGKIVVSGLPGFGYRQHWTRNVSDPTAEAGGLSPLQRVVPSGDGADADQTQPWGGLACPLIGLR